MNTKDITEAWATVRLQNNSIPDDVLDFMKDSAIAALSSTPAGEDVELLANDILSRFNPNREYPNYYHYNDIISAMELMHSAALQNKVPVEDETSHLLSTEANKNRLLESIKQVPVEADLLYKAAIDAMEACAKSYDARFEIYYKNQNKRYVSPYSGKWKIHVFAQIFSDKNFLKATRKAVEYVIQFKDPKLLNSEQELQRSNAEELAEKILAATREYAINNDCPISDKYWDEWVEPMIENAVKEAAIQSHQSPIVPVECYGDEKTKALAIAAARYGFNYGITSQHNGEVPVGNILQWLEWHLTTLPNTTIK